METVLEIGPPIGQHTFSSDFIHQRMPPVPTFLTFPPMGQIDKVRTSQIESGVTKTVRSNIPSG